MPKSIPRKGVSRAPVDQRLRPIAYCVMLACCELAAAANPSGPQVMQGAVQMQGLGTSNLKITNSPGSIIHWQGFSIGAGSTTQFIQQNAASSVLNRVVGADISQIHGQLLSNGRVFLINPAGIVVGPGGIIDTAGFVGSTLNMLNGDFLAGKLKFQADGAAGSIRNDGLILARHGGDVVLIAPQVENGASGIIESKGGEIVLAAGQKLTVGSARLEGVQFEVQAPSDSVVNVGKLIADGGAIGLFASTLKHSGDIRADALTQDARGRIVLKARDDVTLTASSTTSANGKTGGSVLVQSESGTTLVSGRVEAKGSEGKGGDVRVLGRHVGVIDSATIDASGNAGGGQILVGGDFQGKNPDVQNAQATYLGPDATLRANAGSSGDGGRIIAWADDATRAYGAISARGGAQGGDGGFVETSGHVYLDVTRPPDVGAPAGRGGNWLIDPGEVTVRQGGANTNISGAPANFAPSDPNATSVLTASTINTAIDSQANVTVSTGTGAGTGSGDIIFDAALGGPIFITKTPGTVADSTLTFNAARDIRFVNGTTTFEAQPAGNAANLVVRLNPAQNGTGGIVTAAGATTTLRTLPVDLGSSVRMEVLPGKTWQNDGTINIGILTTLRLLNNGGTLSTLQNNGTINIPQAPGASPIHSATDVAVPVLNNLSIVNNNGILNVSGDTAQATLAVAFTNTTSGTLNVTGGAGGSVALPNGQTIAGAVDIAPNTQLRITNGTPTFSGTTITNSGTVNVLGGLGVTPQATFSGVTASNASLNVDANGTALFQTTPSTFANATIAPAPGAFAGVAGALTTVDTALTINNNLTVNGTATFNGTNATVANLTTLNGTITGTGPFRGNNMDFGGTISGTGVKTFTGTVSNGATATLTGNMALDGATAVWNNGEAVNQSGAGQLTLLNGATVNNNDGWTLSSSSPTPITHGGGAATTFNNNGGSNFDKSGGTAQTITVTNFNNNGAGISITGASLTLPGNSVGDTGDISVANGLTLGINGNRTFNAGADITGLGNLDVMGGTVSLRGIPTGTLTVSGGAATFNSAVTPSSVSVTNGTATFASTLTTGGGLSIQGGTTAFNVAGSNITGQLSLGGTGTLTGAGGVTAGTGLWTGGTMNTAGETVITGGLTISGTGAKTFNQGNLRADGLVTWTGDGTIASNGGTFTLRAGMTISGNGVWGSTGTGAALTRINNDDPDPGPVVGIIRNGSTGTAALDNVRLTSSGVIALGTALGTVDVQTGRLRIGQGLPVNAGLATSTSNVSVANTAVLEYAGGQNAIDGTATGLGQILVSGGTLAPGGAFTPGALNVTNGTVQFSNAVNVSPGRLDVSGGVVRFVTSATTGGGSLSGPGAIEIQNNMSLTLTGGTFDWNGGTLRGIGGAGPRTFAVNGPAILNIATAAVHTMEGSVTLDNNSGTVNWTGGSIEVGALGGTNVINNDSAWNATSNGTIPIPAAGSLTFTNAGTGTFVKSGAGTTTTLNIPFENDGTVTINSGTLSLNGGSISTSTGNWGVAANQTLQFGGGAHSLSGDITDATLSLPGNLTISDGTFTTGGDVTTTGALTISGATATFGVRAAALTPNAVSISNGATATFNRTLNGSGTFDMSSGTANFGVAGTVAGPATLTGGTITGVGLTVNGTTTVAAGTTVQLTGTTLDTDVFNMTGGGLSIDGSSTLLVSGAAASAVTGGTLTNAGTLSKTGGGSLTFSGAAVLTNSNVLDAQIGTTISYGGTQNFNGGTNFMGAGQNLVTSNSVFTGAIATTNLTLAGGDSSGTATLTGTTGWTGGNISGNFTIPGGSTLTASGGTPTLSGMIDMRGTLALTGGTSVTNNGTVEQTGVVTIAAGSMFTNAANRTYNLDPANGTGITGAGTFQNNGILNSLGKPIALVGAVFNNAGTANIDAGTLRLTASGTHGGTFDVDAGTTLEFGGGTHTLAQGVANGGIVGAGSLLLSGTGALRVDATGQTKVIGLPFDNGGMLRVLNGTLRLTRNGNHTGNFELDPGTTLEFGGGAHVLTSTGQIGTGGSIAVSAGSLTTNAAINTAGGLLVSGGGLAQFDATATFGGASTLSGGGTIQGTAAVTLDNGLTASGGTIAGAGGVTVNGTTSTVSAGGTLTLPGTLNLGTNAAFANNGTVNQTGLLTLAGGSTFTNAATTGIYNLTPANNTGITGAGTFQNNGTLNSSGNTTALISAVYNNAGTTNVDAGTLRLTGGGSHGGTFDVDAGTTLDFGNGNHILTAGVANGGIVGAGTLLLSGGTLRVNAPGQTKVIGLTFNNSSVFNVDAGTLRLTANGTHSGLFDLASGATLEFGGGAHTLSGNIGNLGNLAVTGGTLTTTDPINTAGGLTVSGAGVAPQFNAPATFGGASSLTGGTLGGTATVTINNAFAMNGGTIASTLIVNGTTTLSGTSLLPGVLNTDVFNMTGGTLGLTGTLVVPGGGASAVSGGTLTNAASGTLVVSNNSTLTLSGASALDNSGRLETQTGGSIVYGAATQNFRNGSLFIGPGNRVVADAIFDGTIDGTPRLEAGTFTGTAEFAGVTAWSGGTIGGAFTIPDGAQLNLTGAGTKTVGGAGALLTNRGAMTVDGTLSLSNNGNAVNDGNLVVNAGGALAIDAGSTFTNALNRTFNLSSTTVTGAGTFQNDGTVNANGAGAIGNVYNNTGTTNVDGGTLRLTGGGANTGRFDVDGGTTLEFGGGTHNLNGGLGITGLGAIVVSGGTLNFNTATVLGNAFTLTGAGTTLGGSGALVLNGQLTWSQGAGIAGAGTLVTTGLTTVTGTGNGIAKNWTNAVGGTVNMDPGASFAFTGASTLTNRGTFNLPTSGVPPAGAVPIADASAVGTFVNDGMFNKAGPGLQSVLANAFTNASNGELNVSNGTLAIPALAVNAGVITLSNNAVLTTNGVNGINITTTGTLRGIGTVDVGGQTVFNNGLVAPGASPGKLTIVGNYTQGPDGTLHVELGGIQQGVTYDWLEVLGTANLDGILQVVLVPGFTPGPNDRFEFMTYNTRLGDFSTFQLPPGSSLAAVGESTIYVLRFPFLLENDALKEAKRLNDRFTDEASEKDQEFKPEKESLICSG